MAVLLIPRLLRMNKPTVVNVEEFINSPKKRVMDLSPFGKEYFLVKESISNSDVLQLVSSKCLHQGLPLEPVMNKGKFKCPWHGCEFQVTTDSSVPSHAKLKIIDTLKVVDSKITI